ncbi:MAG: TetR/AcrR family transcriptional regulator [Turicibacter sp.]|nr:TetR/AcrR family transcriptional regulator [Turicibacter sp.]
MPQKPVLKEADKLQIRARLLAACEKRWASHGYRKTTIRGLCQDADTSIGTFYTLYPTKEDLFLDTNTHIHERMWDNAFKAGEGIEGIAGFTAVIKEFLREQDRFPLFHTLDPEDTHALVSNLDDEQLARIQTDHKVIFQELMLNYRLHLKVPEGDAFLVIEVLLMSLVGRMRLGLESVEFYKAFDFMADRLIPALFK